MGTRIPLRIYVLEESSPGTYKMTPNPWKIVNNKTADDINGETSKISSTHAGYIILDNHDLIDIDFGSDTKRFDVFELTPEEAIKASQEGAPGYYYISYQSDRYYLYNSRNEVPAGSNVFEFYVNPERITPSYRKLITETKTRGGWDIQHWGDQLTELRVEGRTGGLNRLGSDFVGPVPKFIKTKDIDITRSPAWQKLNELKQFYSDDHRQVREDGTVIKMGLNFYDRFYVGYFTEFTGPMADAEKPFIMNYSFTFKVESNGESLLDSSEEALQYPKLTGE